MKPIKLTMCAFGSYGKETVIDFTDVEHGLFLITGDTGSGKTTIFDGITFAIYGETSGGKRDGRMMRSQFASPAEETYVELTFSYRGEVYTVRRTPEYMREKKRGSGLVKAPATVELTLPDGTAFRGKLKETDRKLCEIMGIDREQFTHIAMIAQGDFLRLLHAKSEDRKKIFSTIFHTDICRKVEEELGSARKELKEKIAGSVERLRAHVQGILPPVGVLEEMSKNVLTSAPENTSADSQKSGSGNSSQSMPESLRNHDPLQALPGARERLQAIQGEENPELGAVREIAELFLEIQKRVIGTQTETLNTVENRYTKALTEREEARTVNERLKALERLQQTCEEAAKKEKTYQAEKEQLQQSVQAYEIKNFEDRAQQTKAELERAEQTYAACVQKSEHAKQACRELLQLTEEVDPSEVTDAMNHTTLLPYLTDWKARIRELELIAEKKNNLEKQQIRIEQDERLCGKKQDEQMKHVEKLTALRTEYGTVQERFFLEQAGILAKERLQPGMPCPVCGSTEHPSPAVLSADAVTEVQVRQAQEKWEKQRTLCEQVRLEIQGELARIAEVKTQIAAAVSEMPERLDEKRDLLRRLIAAAEQVEQMRETLQRSSDAKTHAQTVWEQAVRDFDMARVEHGFEEIGHYRDAVSRWTTKRELESARKANDQYFTELHGLQVSLRTLQEQMEGKSYTDLSLMDEQIQSQKSERDRLLKEKEQSSVRIQNYETLLRILDTEEKQYSRLLEQFLLYDNLWQVASGKIKGSVRVDFETYVQRMYFEKILDAANRRFFTFTDGRMKLKSRPLEDVGLMGAAGLEINVYVMATGKERDVKTLSGGESFLASLALALGLSDVVQSQAGSVRLESMFVDEGFGALDDTTRNQAIRVLGDLAGDDRLVGIISHVNDLKDHIDRKLVVTRTAQGSSAAWHGVH